MNIKISHNWLLEYLDTNATPYEIQKYLSLCGPSVDTVKKIGDDYIYDIEITSNRIDSASVFGIAQECQAILPMFGKRAFIKKNPLELYVFKQLTPKNYNRTFLKIKTDSKLNPRFTAIVLSNIKITPSPDFISQRLANCGIKSINNVVDISNYLMLSLGQPCHIFDYDKIKNGALTLRKSQKGENIVTLDEKNIVLPGEDIVIEDGEKRLIDLCGIMGGLNSCVSAKTTNIVLFVQTYEKTKIRRTSILTGQRTLASTYFEKGLDPERVEPTFVLGLHLLEKYASAKISSALYDIYPSPYKPVAISLDVDDIERIIGIKIPEKKISLILSTLGFKNYLEKDQTKLQITVPSFRQNDISIKEDLVEEITRVFGYCNLPNNLPPPVYVTQPKETEKLFDYQLKIKYFLKHLGLNEVMNYSMISKEMIEKMDLKISDHLRLKNSISQEIEYLRAHLTPSLLKNIRDNEGKNKNLKFFEIAKTYRPIKNNLPSEKYKLGIIINTNFFELKGIVESLFKELNIENFKIVKNNSLIFSDNVQGQVIIDKIKAGEIGQIKALYKNKNKIKSEMYLCVLDLEILLNKTKVLPSYKPIKNFNVIKLDLTINTKKNYEEILKTSFRVSKYLKKLEFLSKYQNKLSLRFLFSDENKNLTENEAKHELEKIKKSI